MPTESETIRTELFEDNRALRSENERLRASLKHIRQIATDAALGKRSGIDHFWYAEEITRVLSIE